MVSLHRKFPGWILGWYVRRKITYSYVHVHNNFIPFQAFLSFSSLSFSYLLQVSLSLKTLLNSSDELFEVLLNWAWLYKSDSFLNLFEMCAKQVFSRKLFFGGIVSKITIDVGFVAAFHAIFVTSTVAANLKHNSHFLCIQRYINAFQITDNEITMFRLRRHKSLWFGQKKGLRFYLSFLNTLKTSIYVAAAQRYRQWSNYIWGIRPSWRGPMVYNRQI